MYENKDKMDEVWINYYGMPVCFGWKEFTIVTGLKCYPPSQVIPILTQKKHPAHPEKAKESRVIVMTWCPLLVFQNKNLIETLKECASVASSDQSRVEDAIFLTLRSVQTLLDPKVINRIKMELFGATTYTRKIILEGGLVVVDGAVGRGSGAAVGANDAPLTVFKENHYEYDHTGYTDLAFPCECSACKCQDCRAKLDVVINAINALAASINELTSKRGLILSKRILFPSAPLEIRAKRRRKVISRALSGIQKSEIATPLSACCTEQRTMYKGKQHELKKASSIQLVPYKPRPLAGAAYDITYVYIGAAYAIAYVYIGAAYSIAYVFIGAVYAIAYAFQWPCAAYDITYVYIGAAYAIAYVYIGAAYSIAYVFIGAVYAIAYAFQWPCTIG
ncbi:hypothetical protein BC332_07473 [Capsicum chinense]|nr:hypothetical protein BC332_07473 [Capsicum chinense]